MVGSVVCGGQCGEWWAVGMHHQPSQAPVSMQIVCNWNNVSGGIYAKFFLIVML